ncbi:SNF2 family N-terminal domain-containing protein [Annulohypoxylon moriforme]|nr:SNF2 family N-terminal domain-containing protein [Annulohypoxylon moriforme]
MNENDENIHTRPPILGIKRSWEDTHSWNEGSEAAPVGPAKRACTSGSVNFQESNISEVANLNYPKSLSPIHPQGFEYTTSTEPITPNSSIFSRNYQLPPSDNTGFPSYYSPDILNQGRDVISQDLSTQTYGSWQQWAPQNDEEWQAFSPVGNIYDNWPVSDFSSFQNFTINNGQIHWEVPGRVQQDQPMNQIKNTHSTAENDETRMSNDMEESSSYIDDSGDEKSSGPQDGNHASLAPSLELPTMPRDIVTDGLVTSDESSKGSSYDTCFGVITLEGFKVSEDFLKEKATTHISLKVNGSMVTIHEANSNRYGGLLDRSASQVISDLVRNYGVELSAYMEAPNKVEVLIYGNFEEGEAIGDMLLEQDCFLQKPESYDTSRPYHNPQCLYDPNEEESFWEDDELSPPQGAVLREKEKNKVTELLDSATGPTNFRRVQISEVLVSKLKEHQIKALSMMTEKESGNICKAEFPSVWSESSDTKLSNKRFYNHVTQSYTSRTPKLCLGGLLADDMGLGKTLTTLALIATSLNNGNMTLIICPMTTITCWQDQIERHFRKGSLDYKIYHGSTRHYDIATLKGTGIVLTTYETLRAELPDEGGIRRGLNKSTKTDTLHSIDWHRVVLDEAHIVRNRTTKMFRSVHTLKARHRWCLTGTPIQNRLEDLGALVEFLRVDPFNNRSVFKSTFLAPIDQGKQSGWEQLRLLVGSIALRRTKNTLDSDLNIPPRREIIRTVDLNEKERSLYDLMKRKFSLAINSEGSTMKTFQLILRLRQICNHGSDLLPHSLRAWLDETSAFDTSSLQLQRCEKCDVIIDEEDELSRRILSCFHQICRTCFSNDGSPVNITTLICPLCDGSASGESTESSAERRMTFGVDPTIYHPSSKVEALLRNLEEDRREEVTSSQPSAKSVIFSSWTGMLDLISKALSAKTFKYQRLDGSMNLSRRNLALEDFRKNPNCTILLASLGSAAVGLDLTMATRVHLMEPGWNPLLEQQAIDRIHRLGQDKEVTATRYIVSGSDSIEQYILERQEQKINLITSSLEESKARDTVGNILRVSLN